MNSQTVFDPTVPAPLSTAERDLVRVLAFVALTAAAGFALAAAIGATGADVAPLTGSDWHGNVATSR